MRFASLQPATRWLCMICGCFHLAYTGNAANRSVSRQTSVVVEGEGRARAWIHGSEGTQVVGGDLGLQLGPFAVATVISDGHRQAIKTDDTLLLAASAVAAPRCVVEKGGVAHLSDGMVQAAFDGSSGALASLKNLATGAEYLSGGPSGLAAQGREGNPFRLVLAPQRLPPAAEPTGGPYGDPSFSDSPWPDGTLGGTFLDARDFNRSSAACSGAGALTLTMVRSGTACGTLVAELNASRSAPCPCSSRGLCEIYWTETVSI